MTSGISPTLSPRWLRRETRRGASFDIDGAKFVELPSTAEEIASVAEVAGDAALALSGRDATESGFKAMPLDRYQVLHLAVHGIANEQFPHRAALVLGTDPDSGDDGLLQVREILDLRLTAELVTLSACDTAAGRLQGQEESPASFGRSCLQAPEPPSPASGLPTTSSRPHSCAASTLSSDRAPIAPSALRNAKLENAGAIRRSGAPLPLGGIHDGRRRLAANRLGAEYREP